MREHHLNTDSRRIISLVTVGTSGQQQQVHLILLKMGAHPRLVISSFILKIAILIHLGLMIEASPNIEDLDLHSRVSKIETKDHHQDREISLLKNALVEEKELVQDLTNRLGILEDSNKVFGRSKRPYRLLPPHIIR